MTVHKGPGPPPRYTKSGKIGMYYGQHGKYDLYVEPNKNGDPGQDVIRAYYDDNPEAFTWDTRHALTLYSEHIVGGRCYIPQDLQALISVVLEKEEEDVFSTPCNPPGRDGEWAIQIGKEFFSVPFCDHKEDRATIVAINEGGYNSTEVCLYCVLELAVQMKFLSRKVEEKR